MCIGKNSTCIFDLRIYLRMIFVVVRKTLPSLWLSSVIWILFSFICSFSIIMVLFCFRFLQGDRSNKIQICMYVCMYVCIWICVCIYVKGFIIRICLVWLWRLASLNLWSWCPSSSPQTGRLEELMFLFRGRQTGEFSVTQDGASTFCSVQVFDWLDEPYLR